MAIVQEPNGDVQICMDVAELNKLVEQEVQPLPVSTHVLVQLSELTIFSMLVQIPDFSSSSWQRSPET